MLGSFFSAKPDHPLAEPKEAKRILDTLAAREPLGALDEATGLLESLGGVAAFKPDQRQALVLQIDEAAVVAARRLARDYVSTRLSRTQEQRLWQAAHDYWAGLMTAQADCVSRYSANEKGTEAMKPALPLLFARLLHAGRQRRKWEQFHYGPMDPNMWQLLGLSYLSAAAARVATSEVQLYAGGGATTPEAEYLKLLVFQASSMDNLLLLEIEIAEYLIAHFLPHFVFTADIRPDNVYWVDAAKALPPARLARPPEMSPTLRFFNSSPAVDAIEQLRLRIGRDGQVPGEVNLGGQYPPAKVLPVLDHLAMCWSPKPPMRKDTRHRVKSRLTVVHGVTELHHQLEGLSEFGESESWVVDDVSVGGMGAKVPLGAAGGNWVRIGSVIGIKPEGADNWLVGIVRRFARESASVGAVGIETVSKAPRAIVADAGGLETEGVLLDPLRQGDSVRVVLPATKWEEGVSLLFSLDGARIRLFPEVELEASADAVLARFFVQSVD